MKTVFGLDSWPVVLPAWTTTESLAGMHGGTFIPSDLGHDTSVGRHGLSTKDPRNLNCQWAKAGVGLRPVYLSVCLPVLSQIQLRH